MFKSAVLLSVALFSQISFADGTTKAYVSLNPAGDFIATMKTTGTAQLIGGKISAKNIVVDMKSLSTGLDLRDDHAKNKYLDVNKYPEAILMEATGENGKGQGKLSYRGKENLVTGTYTVQGGKILLAVFNIKLSQFGVSDINYKGIGVEDDVKIEVQVPIGAAAAAPAAPTKPAATKGAAAPAAKPGTPAAKTPAPTQPLKK